MYTEKKLISEIFRIAKEQGYTIEQSCGKEIPQINFGTKKLHESHIKQLSQSIYSELLKKNFDESKIKKSIDTVAPGRPCIKKPFIDILKQIRSDIKVIQKEAFYFQWHFIDSCNLRCTHCYQEDYTLEHLPQKDLFKIARSLDIAMGKWRKKGRVSLTGGEPFLKPELLFSLIEFFERADNFYWIGILSNGTLIDESIAKKLSRFQKISEIQISIDGASEHSHDKIRGHNTFNKAIKALKILKEHKFFTSIMFTLHKQNQNEAIPILELAEKIGVDAITIERITPMRKQDINAFYINSEELKNVYKKIFEIKKVIEKRSNLKIRVSRPLWTLIDDNLGGFCPAGLTSLSILQDGTVLPCRRLEIPIGNILTEGLYKIWYTSDILWKLRNKDNLSGKCYNCKYIHACGGCRAIAYTVNNDFMAGDPQCWL
jgi:radical SAM protein with 4Fe4S-binding SPASM domain